MDLSSTFKIGGIARSKVNKILSENGFLVNFSRLKKDSPLYLLKLGVELKTRLEALISVSSPQRDLTIASIAELYDLIDALAEFFSITKKEIRDRRKLMKSLYGNYKSLIHIKHLEKLTDELKQKLEKEAELVRSASASAKKASKKVGLDSTGVNAFFEQAYNSND